MYHVNKPVLKLHRMQDRLLVLDDLLYNAGMYESNDCGRFNSFDIDVGYHPMREEYEQWKIDMLTEYHEYAYCINSITNIDFEAIIYDLLPPTHS